MGVRRDDEARAGTSPEELLEGYFRQLLGDYQSSPHWEETDFPPLDIFETAGDLVVEAELPGIDTGRLEVSVAAGLLIVEGVKEEILESGRVNFLCMERTFGSFRRVVPLLHPIDSSRIKAFYRMGVLHITIPKVEEKRGVRRVVPVTKE